MSCGKFDDERLNGTIAHFMSAKRILLLCGIRKDNPELMILETEKLRRTMVVMKVKERFQIPASWVRMSLDDERSYRNEYSDNPITIGFNEQVTMSFEDVGIKDDADRDSDRIVHRFPKSYKFKDVKQYLCNYVLFCDEKQVVMEFDGVPVNDEDEVANFDRKCIKLNVDRKGLVLQQFTFRTKVQVVLFKLYVREGATHDDICRRLGTSMMIPPFRIKIAADNSITLGPDIIYCRFHNEKSVRSIRLADTGTIDEVMECIRKQNLWGLQASADKIQMVYRDRFICKNENLIQLGSSDVSPIIIYPSRPYKFLIGREKKCLFFPDDSTIARVMNWVNETCAPDRTARGMLLHSGNMVIPLDFEDCIGSDTMTLNNYIEVLFNDVSIRVMFANGKRITIQSDGITTCERLKELIQKNGGYPKAKPEDLCICLKSKVLAPSDVVKSESRVYCFMADHQIECHVTISETGDTKTVTMLPSESFGDLRNKLNHSENYGIFVNDELAGDSWRICSRLFPSPDAKLSLRVPLATYKVIFGNDAWQCRFEENALCRHRQFFMKIKRMFSADDIDEWRLDVSKSSMNRTLRMLLESSEAGLRILGVTTAMIKLTFIYQDSKETISHDFKLNTTVENVVAYLQTNRKGASYTFWSNNKEIWKDEKARIIDSVIPLSENIYVVCKELEQVAKPRKVLGSRTGSRSAISCPVLKTSEAPVSKPATIADHRRQPRSKSTISGMIRYGFALPPNYEIKSIMLMANITVAKALTEVQKFEELDSSKQYGLSLDTEYLLDNDHVLSADETSLFVCEVVYINIDSKSTPLLVEWDVATAKDDDHIEWANAYGIIIGEDTSVEDLAGIDVCTVAEEDTREICVCTSDGEQIFNVNSKCYVREFVKYLTDNDIWSLGDNAVCGGNTVIDLDSDVLGDVVGSLKLNPTKLRIAPEYVLNEKLSTMRKVPKALGQGTFGRVHLYQNDTTGERLAVKSVRDRLTAAVVKEFNREVDAFINLHHPCILSFRGIVIEKDEDDCDEYKIVTDFMPNGSLQDLIKRLRSGDVPKWWNPTNIAIIVTGIACGMKYVHAHGLWHRDIKPGNILLDENFHARIGDFGSSRATNLVGSLTSAVGTPQYVAPEVSQGEKYDESIDVYSFGLIVYELLTKEPIIRGSEKMTPFIIIQTMCGGHRPRIPEWMSTFTQDMITNCWDKAPYNRPTFEDICESLERINFEILDGVDGAAVRTLYDQWK